MDIKRIKTIYEQENDVQIELVTVDGKENLFIYDKKGICRCNFKSRKTFQFAKRIL